MHSWRVAIILKFCKVDQYVSFRSAKSNHTAFAHRQPDLLMLSPSALRQAQDERVCIPLRVSGS